jgi:hypothetical protein
LNAEESAHYHIGMALRRWRRTHGSEFRAHVDPGDDARWIVSIWQGDTCVQQKKRRFRMLTDAQASADTLVREQFAHECDPACGDWGPYSA